jgi:hypothetical protein
MKHENAIMILIQARVGVLKRKLASKKSADLIPLAHTLWMGQNTRIRINIHFRGSRIVKIASLSPFRYVPMGWGPRRGQSQGSVTF